MIEKYKLENDIKVIGVPVTSFPNGIGEVFESLINLLPGGASRSYYGISEMEDDQITYIATGEEKSENEAKVYRCNRYEIERGEYLAITLKDWQTKTDSIKEIFHELMQDKRSDHSKPCIEWYKSDQEMLCMMKVNKTSIG